MAFNNCFVFTNTTGLSEASWCAVPCLHSRTQADGAVSIWALLFFGKREEQHFKPASSKNYCEEVMHNTPAHILLAKVSHMVFPNCK